MCCVVKAESANKQPLFCFRKIKLQTFEINDSINQFVESDLKKKKERRKKNNELKLRCHQIGREIKLQQLSWSRVCVCCDGALMKWNGAFFRVYLYFVFVNARMERSKKYRIEFIYIIDIISMDMSARKRCVVCIEERQ